MPTEAVSIADQWLPVLVSTVLVFIASSIVWLVLPFHRNDWGPVPQEDEVRELLRKLGLKPGQYALPSCGGDAKKMRTPEFQKKLEEGPMALMIVGRSGPPRMGRSLTQWFLYSLAIGVFTAYLTGHFVAAGAPYLHVFRIAGTLACVAYAMAIIPGGIWFSRTWRSIWKEVADGVLYGLLTAGSFAWLYPGA